MTEITTGPTGPASPVDRNSLVTWVVVAATTYSTLRFGAYLLLTFFSDPVAWVLAMVLWTIYGVLALWFLIAHEMLARRPRGLISAALVWGSVTACGIAIDANKALDEILVRITSPALMTDWGASLTAPFVEETLKILGLIAIALVAPRAIRSTADGLFFGVLVGLGFQVAENVVYSLAGAGAGGVLIALLGRGLATGLFSHALYTGIAGAGVGYFLAHPDRPRAQRLAVAIGLYLAAFGLHFLWDSPLVVSLWWSIVVIGLPGLLLILVLIRAARARERRDFEALTSTAVDTDVIRPDEVDDLESRRRRKIARKRTRREVGRKAAGIRRRLQYAQLEYVNAVRDGGPESPYATQLADIIGKRYGAIDQLAAARRSSRSRS